MQYNIKGTGLSISDEVRDYIEKKLPALEKLASGAARADIELEFLASEEKSYRAEFMVHDPGTEAARAEARGATLHEAIDLALNEVAEEFTREKKKRLHLVRRGAAKMKEFIRGWRRDV